LSLDDYARIIGLNGAHFNTAANSLGMPYSDCCSDIFFQHDWQFNGRTSREALAQAIASAERDIAEVLGYWPAPMWIAEENHPFPRPHRPDMVQYGGLDVRGYRKSIVTDYGYVIAPGQREVTQIPQAAVAYTDEDADGNNIKETATVTVATTLTDECELKVYFAGHGGDQEWEIRPARTKAIALGVFTATFWSWQFILPALWEALPAGADPTPIDYDDAGNLVATIEVYREFNDTSATSSRFYWEPQPTALCSCGGVGTCVACALTTQDGCLHVRDAVNGVVVPHPADYDDDDEEWDAASWSVCRDPDMVNLWYYAGDTNNLWRRGTTCEQLSPWWQQTIAWLATARLERPFCSCDSVVDLVKDLRTDLSLTGGPLGYNITLDDLSNPFGSRKGAILAWRRISKLARKVARVAVI